MIGHTEQIAICSSFVRHFTCDPITTYLDRRGTSRGETGMISFIVRMRFAQENRKDVLEAVQRLAAASRRGTGMC